MVPRTQNVRPSAVIVLALLVWMLMSLSVSRARPSIAAFVSHVERICNDTLDVDVLRDA
jgi:hypothetical protein